MAKSSIEWTDAVWNPVSGCTRVSAGCDNCYAVKMTKRLEAMGKPKYAGLVNIGKAHFNGVVRCHEDALTIPLRAKKPRRWFVNSMSDLFHRDVSFDFIDKVFAVMAHCPQHTFQILTKRPERMAEYFSKNGPPDWAWQVRGNLCPKGPRELFIPAMKGNNHLPNVWLGTSVESADVLHRIDELRECPASVRFLSLEPLIGDLGTINLDGIHWVIVGGESGPGARPMHPNWARSLRDQCVAAGVPYFFKQWGAWCPDDALSGEPLTIAQKVCGPDREYVAPSGEFDGMGLLPGIVTMNRVGKKTAGRLLDGRTWDEFPEVAR